MSVKIALTGDFCPIGRVDVAIRQDDAAGLFPGVDDLLLGSDIVIIDLECPLTDGGAPITKTGPHLKGSPKAAKVLRELGCDLVATANNHFMDFGIQGLHDTYESLKENGIRWVGSGQSFAEATTHEILECKGLRIAVVNMTENEWSTTHGAYPGCSPIDFPAALREIRAARATADFVVVVLHGGHEHYDLPSPRMQQQFRFMVDAGADAVIGHHTHVVSGYEKYRGKPIFYSLGNFCIDSPTERSSGWNQGIILVLEIAETGEAGFQIFPIEQNSNIPGARLMDGVDRDGVISRIEQLSKVIADEQALEARFEQFCQSRASIVRSQIQPYTSPLLLALHRRGLFPSLIGRRKRKLLAALCQCESHREVLLSALRKSA